MAKKEKYKISNIDISIELEKPKISIFLDEIKNNLVKILDVEKNQISIKANTNEGVGEVGRSEAVCAYSICLLEAYGSKR